MIRINITIICPFWLFFQVFICSVLPLGLSHGLCSHPGRETGRAGQGEQYDTELSM